MSYSDYKSNLPLPPFLFAMNFLKILSIKDPSSSRLTLPTRQEERNQQPTTASTAPNHTLSHKQNITRNKDRSPSHVPVAGVGALSAPSLQQGPCRGGPRVPTPHRPRTPDDQGASACRIAPSPVVSRCREGCRGVWREGCAQRGVEKVV